MLRYTPFIKDECKPINQLDSQLDWWAYSFNAIAVPSPSLLLLLSEISQFHLVLNLFKYTLIVLFWLTYPLVVVEVLFVMSILYLVDLYTCFDNEKLTMKSRKSEKS